ncbi:hypothetical protein [Legionella fairfieldensis]|uniref:hypothetical protein n=1 Tax=Legionella fairfieldensis TaxID=45064 RepID=UPI00048B2312|nr:hypothetical protein [Legionella fairfieldensis]
MKKLLSTMLGTGLIFAASVSFATANTTTAPATDLSAKWTCTTNASSATTDTDKAADDQMAKMATSAANAFSAAAQNCRDCTKITCTVGN